MLKTTPVELHLGMVIGLGDIGARVVESLHEVLDRRLGATLVIGLVTLSPDFTAAPGPIRHEVDHGIHRIRLPFDPNKGAAWGSVPQNNPATPGGATVTTEANGPEAAATMGPPDPKQMRRIGYETLKQHGIGLQSVIDDIQGSIRTQDVLDKVRGRPDKKITIDETGLDVFVVGALDEPFASGAFLDLAYLVDKTLQEISGERFNYYTSGLLFLPNYRREDADAIDSVREADTYAALKELDFYSAHRHYEASYGPRLSFTTKAGPFNHSCYLVEASNERNRGLAEPAHLTTMASEWLYRYLTSPLARYLPVRGADLAWRTAAGRVTAYSGLGIASFILPIDETIEDCAIRLGQEMVENYFRRELTGQDRNEPQRQAAAFRGALIDRTIGQEILAVDQGRGVRSLDIPPQQFSGLDAWDSAGLRAAVKSLFGQRHHQTLPSIKQEMVTRAEEALQSAREMLAEKVRLLINESPDAGVSRALIFLDALKADLEQQARESQKGAKGSHDQEKLADERIALSRAEYLSAAETLGTWPGRIWLGLTVAVLVGLLICVEDILLRRLPDLMLTDLGRQLLDLANMNLVAGGVLIAGTLVMLGVAGWYLWDWLNTVRNHYLANHRDRLVHSLAKARYDLFGRFLQKVGEAVTEQLGVVTQFRDCLDDLSEALKKLRQTPRALYGQLRFPLEESVLTAGDVDAFYKEMSKFWKKEEGLRDVIARLMLEQARRGRLFYDWRDVQTDALRDIIVEFGKTQMENLRRWKTAEWLLIEHLEITQPEDWRVDAIKTLIEQAAAKLALAEGEEPLLPPPPELTPDQREALRRRLEELLIKASPFLRFNSVELPVDAAPRLVQMLGVATTNQDQSQLNQVTKQNFGDVGLVETRDPHSIVAMTTRHGLPLYALGMARRYRSRYQRHFGDKPLHTRDEYQALPDVFPLTEGMLEPQLATVLGALLKIEDAQGRRHFILDRNKAGEYFYSYQDKRRVVPVPLGRDKMQICLLLQQQQSEHLQRISDQIEEAITAWAKRDGNPAIIQYLEDYLTRNGDNLDQWEIGAIEEYIGYLQ